MILAGTVMAHEKRKDWAEDLSAELGLPITWDRINDRHETGLRCLEAGLASDASHWLVIQDDALVCRDLVAGIERAVEVSGDRLVGLYVGNVRPQTAKVTQRVRAAQATGVPWVAMPGPWWGVGIVIPTKHLPSLVESYRASKDSNYDKRIERWATKAKVECWYTMPSLVDHRSGAQNPSLVPGRTSITRSARWFIGAEASALDIDWAAQPQAPVHQFWRNARTGQVRRLRSDSVVALRFARLPMWSEVVESACDSCGQAVYEPLDHDVIKV